MLNFVAYVAINDLIKLCIIMKRLMGIKLVKLYFNNLRVGIWWHFESIDYRLATLRINNRTFVNNYWLSLTWIAPNILKFGFAEHGIFTGFIARDTTKLKTNNERYDTRILRAQKLHIFARVSHNKYNCALSVHSCSGFVRSHNKVSILWDENRAYNLKGWVEIYRPSVGNNGRISCCERNKNLKPFNCVTMILLRSM